MRHFRWFWLGTAGAYGLSMNFGDITAAKMVGFYGGLILFCVWDIGKRPA